MQTRVLVAMRLAVEKNTHFDKYYEENVVFDFSNW
jgi:hypothetical protein